MASGFRLKIFEANRPLFADEFTGVVELGRQDKGEGGPFARMDLGDRCRLIIASHNEEAISRQHVLVEGVDDATVRIKNLSARVPIRFLDGGEPLPPGVSRDFSLPWLFSLGRKTIRVLAPGNREGEPNLQTLPAAPAPPGALSGLSSRLSGLNMPEEGAMSQEAVIRWLQTTMSVLQAAAGSDKFLDRAAQALVDLVGLDTGRVLLREDEHWKEVATHVASRMPVDQVNPPSRTVLRKVLEERRTFWEVPVASADLGVSLDRVSAVVSAPILGPTGDVVGTLYGDRTVDSSFSRITGPITMPEAMLVEVLAGSISTGLERLRQEKKAIEEQVKFERFFTPELARQLIDHPDMLESKDSEVTLLFCDIRGFSRISETLGPGATMDWVNDVMGTLSDCVTAHQGVLVDYIGDELLAMWGAPMTQPDHAILACRAAIDMLAEIPVLNRRWSGVIKQGFDLGIGINTGPARVGNTGTKRKFKYGPLGNSVNLASRLQGASKYFKTRLIISGHTQERLDDTIVGRRLGKIRVINISEPVEIYELSPMDVPNWEPLRKGYEQALDHFESRNFSQAARTLGILQLEFPNDGPSLILLSRVVNAKVDPETYDPVWTLPSK